MTLLITNKVLSLVAMAIHGQFLRLYINSKGKVSHFSFLMVDIFNHVLPPRFVSPIPEMLVVEELQAISGQPQGAPGSLNNPLPLLGLRVLILN